MTIDFDIEDASTWTSFDSLGRTDLFVLDITTQCNNIRQPRGYEEIADVIVERLRDSPDWNWQLRVFTIDDVVPNRVARLRLERSGPWSQFPDLADAATPRTSIVRDYDDGMSQALGCADVHLTRAYFTAVAEGNAIGAVGHGDGPTDCMRAFAHQPVRRESLFFESLKLAGSAELVMRSHGAFDDREHGFQFFGDHETVRALRDQIA